MKKEVKEFNERFENEYFEDVIKVNDNFKLFKLKKELEEEFLGDVYENSKNVYIDEDEDFTIIEYENEVVLENFRGFKKFKSLDEVLNFFN
jgi:hypothetical protein